MVKTALVAVLFSIGCAGAMARPDSSAQGPCQQAVARQQAVVHAGPDTTSRWLTKLQRDEKVCVGDPAGFGLRRVTLPDGQRGFIEESDLEM